MDAFITGLNEVTTAPLFLTLAGFALAMLVVLWALVNINPGKPASSDMDDKPWLRGVRYLGWFLLPLLALLFLAALAQIISMWTNPPNDDNALALRVHYLALVGFIGVLGGILGAFTAYIRIFTTERQTTAQEQGLITERINKAVENLGATRVNPDGAHDPNLEVRIGAIYALERIAQDSLRDHVQIMEILTAYIRHNAPTETIPYNETIRNPVCRDDVQAALVVIGQRSANQIKKERAHTVNDKKIGYQINLMKTDLRGAALSNLNFENARFFTSHFHGTVLRNAQLTGADFRWAVIDDSTDFRNADISRSAVGGTSWQHGVLTQEQISSCFSDISFTPPSETSRCHNLPNTKLKPLDFRNEWRLWQSNPDAYVPPQHR